MIQKLAYDSENIELDTLSLGGTALIWWESISKTEDYLLKKSKLSLHGISLLQC